jgi:hypothetical protein
MALFKRRLGYTGSGFKFFEKKILIGQGCLISGKDLKRCFLMPRIIKF